MKISAIVLAGETANEELLEKCLKSLAWCDEIVKVEPESKNEDFSKWRNEGAKKAKNEWLFYVDSDEEVTPKLRKEIKSAIKSSKEEVGAFAIPRENILLGKKMRHGGWFPDYVLRLIKKEKLVHWEGRLHEQPKIKGETGYLKSPFIHKKHDDIAGMVEKTNKWSEVEGRLMYEAGHPQMNFFRFASAGMREFWQRMILQTAFLDGVEGTIYGLYQVYSRLISYAKLWEMQIKNEGGNI